MDNIASITRRIAKLKKLAKEYFNLPIGALIPRYDELLRVFDIRGSIHNKKHPHHMKRVYISRRALKHIVESRKEQFTKNHTIEETLSNVDFALDNIQETIINFDVYSLEPTKGLDKHFYIKDFSKFGKPRLKILLECTGIKLEIISIHFTKRNNKNTT